ncbi:hypothetical protein EOI86_22630 [Hwanghaeella grinnelliae]|uniref:Uncharacterized protein n=1 Tax=Hwanghaeella grinnelliae TaxID=2500179 RepID=A0A437QH82_9PROT|nr:hypothetical protein [Hwanghaeella grinnelliae]RVU33927.1 hypothetical protein EOI86_22630 [Hwanghaeella grinnelliae]
MDLKILRPALAALTLCIGGCVEEVQEICLPEALFEKSAVQETDFSTYEQSALVDGRPPRVHVLIDPSWGMSGYVRRTNDALKEYMLFGKFVASLRDTLSASMPDDVDFLFHKLENRQGSHPTQDFDQAIQAFFTTCETSSVSNCGPYTKDDIFISTLVNVSNPLSGGQWFDVDERDLVVIISDLQHQTEAGTNTETLTGDAGRIGSALAGQVAESGRSLSIVGMLSRFEGTIFDLPAKNENGTGTSYATKSGEAILQPFYVIAFGPRKLVSIHHSAITALITEQAKPLEAIVRQETHGGLLVHSSGRLDALELKSEVRPSNWAREFSQIPLKSSDALRTSGSFYFSDNSRKKISNVSGAETAKESQETHGLPQPFLTFSFRRSGDLLGDDRAIDVNTFHLNISHVYKLWPNASGCDPKETKRQWIVALDEFNDPVSMSLGANGGALNDIGWVWTDKLSENLRPGMVYAIKVAFEAQSEVSVRVKSPQWADDWSVRGEGRRTIEVRDLPDKTRQHYGTGNLTRLIEKIKELTSNERVTVGANSIVLVLKRGL